MPNVKAEESLTNDEINILSLPPSPVPHKAQKPCGAVEPEQCKEVEMDTRDESANILITKHTQVPVIVSVDMETREVKENILDLQIINNNESSIKQGLNSEDSDQFPSNLSTPVEDVLPEISISSGLNEEIKLETNTEDLYFISQIYNESIDNQIIEEQLVAEEVVIGPEISHDEVCSTFSVMEDEDWQDKMERIDLMSAIVKPMDSSISNLESLTIRYPEVSKKDQAKQRSHTENITVLDCQENALNKHSLQKVSCIKEQTSTSPENHHFLSSKTSSENNYVSLNRRQDSYTGNDIMLTRMFSDCNPDDGSDDDNRYDNRSTYAGGGKISACINQIDESKSDVGDEFESPSSESLSGSHLSILETSPEMRNINHIPSDRRTPNETQEIKSDDLISIKNDDSNQSSINTEAKHTPTDSHQLMEMSVNLTYMTELGNLNYFDTKEKLNSTDMFSVSDPIVHQQTIADDSSCYILQEELCTLYNTTHNILDTDPVPYPPTVVLSHTTCGFARCQCSYCSDNFRNLDWNYKMLVGMRSNRVCLEVDKNYLLTKMYQQMDQSKVEDERLLKSNEDNDAKKDTNKQNFELCPETFIQTVKLPTQETASTHDNNETLPEIVTPTLVVNALSAAENEKPFQVKETDVIENIIGTKAEHSSLPRKQRKAFCHQSEVATNETSQEDNQCETESLDIQPEVATEI